VTSFPQTLDWNFYIVLIIYKEERVIDRRQE
jgi:hypothetical protein